MRWAINSSYVPMSTPIKQGCAIGGQVNARISFGPSLAKYAQQRGLKAPRTMLSQSPPGVHARFLQDIQFAVHLRAGNRLADEVRRYAVFDETIIERNTSDANSQSPPERGCIGDGDDIISFHIRHEPVLRSLWRTSGIITRPRYYLGGRSRYVQKYNAPGALRQVGPGAHVERYYSR